MPGPLDWLGREIGAILSPLIGGAGGDTLRIAVTGLSRSGKTVFLTSLLANLLALGRGRDTLPGFTRALSGGAAARGIGVRLVPAATETIPRFEIEAKLAALAADQPAWPPRTEDVAAIAVELAVPATGALFAGPRRLRLEFLDYPGEWLLDLPLLDLDYAAWSAATLARLRQPARAAAAAPFLDFLATLDLGRAADELALRQGHALYKAVLLRLRDEHGFRYLQPGRFLCPGPRSDAPFLWFFPAVAAGGAGGGSGLALLRDRFAAYQADVRVQAAQTGFTSFDRQVVLVDVLSALHAGRAAFEDTQAAIADIARVYRYGANTWLRQVLGLASRVIGQGGSAPLIDRAAFVATKADHVPADRRPALVSLLRAMAESGPYAMSAGAAAAGPGLTYHAAAAVRATRDTEAMHADRRLPAVAGVPLGETAARPFYAGDLPGGLPTDRYWQHPYFALPPFTPPRLDASGAAGIPHLGLDDVLLALIADRL